MGLLLSRFRSASAVLSDKASLASALANWCDDPTTVEAAHGPIASWDVSAVTDLEDLFKDVPCTSTFDTDIDGWDVSQVTNMKKLFAGATAYNQPLNTWNVAKVTDMYDLFTRARNFNLPLDGWNVAQVTSMGYMFYSTTFNQPLDGWDVSKVLVTAGMFRMASGFNQPLDGWNVGQVTWMSYMFIQASAFNQDLSSWNLGQVDQMFEMFDGAGSLSDCHKLAMHTSFEAQVPSLWGYDWSSVDTSSCQPPPPPPVLPVTQDGAVIEMTGDDPKLIFGTLEDPTCQLSIDRANSRLVSTCSIQDSRRLEETFDCEAKHAALQQKYEALRTEVSELRGLVDMVKAAKMD